VDLLTTLRSTGSVRRFTGESVADVVDPVEFDSPAFGAEPSS
jgi:hypothetical protein